MLESQLRVLALARITLQELAGESRKLAYSGETADTANHARLEISFQHAQEAIANALIMVHVYAPDQDMKDAAGRLLERPDQSDGSSVAS